MPVARQQIHNMHQWTKWELVFSMQYMQHLCDATIEELLGEMFSVLSLPRCYKQDKFRV
jgi:hypothetical protein